MIYVLILAGEEEGRQSTDPARRRSSGPLMNAGSLSKQKSPIGNESTSKDAMVSYPNYFGPTKGWLIDEMGQGTF